MTALNSNSSLAAITNEINNIQREIENLKSVDVKKDGTGTRRVLNGKRGDDHGLFVSQPTFDVFSCADDELIFNSSNNIFKIVDSGTVVMPSFNVSTNNSQSSVFSDGESYDHNLGYIPVVLAFVEDADGHTLMPFAYTNTINSTIGNWLTVQFYAEADDNSIYFNYKATQSSTGSVSNDYPAKTIKFYILQETAN